MKYEDYLGLYKTKTFESMNLYFKAREIFPGGVSHNIRYFKPYPFFTRKARGKFLYDVGGNKYLDFWNGHWALILGHSPPKVTQKLRKQLKNGTLYGTANKASLKLGWEIKKAIPWAENTRFCSTGSEATMYAIRLARSASGKRVIAKVEGGWHGFNTNLLQSVNYPYEVDEGLGLIEDEGHFVESLQFNDLDRSLKVLESIKDDLAPVIVEPVLGGAGCILPKNGYLQGLQEFAQKNDSLFILDEIVTGFRFSYGAALDRFKLEPDLFTLGKIIGGGLPIGAVCGKKEIMKLADATTEGDKSTYCSIGGGTFSANPLTMKAGYHTLKTLRNDTSIYDKINNLGEITRVGLSKIFNELEIRAEVTGIGSLFMIHFLNDKVKTIHNALDAALSNKEMLNNYNLALMARHNIFFLPGKMGAFSNAHEEKDSNRLLNATRNIFEDSKNATTS
ncbi:MAG TPA: aminotransferase class III-fold pyridoxal phosphate-dependent enzyme [Candidatus Nitrosocosmicus sp.]|nr:aminotransferase class III-fold pyridoxal phosphate-dependent enzyme [Candidatus Nitrosocosmicus sp.]